MARTAIHTPFDQGDAQRVGGRLYRKQLLPVGSIDYRGQRLDFTREYLSRLADNFNAGTYDQVPFVLADEANRHTDDPEKFRGEVKALELANDGLYALVELSEDGAKIVKDNPRLGISARIMQQVERAGQKVGDAIQHVCGSLDPVVQGMKPWEGVELSDTDDVTVVDLTSSSVTVSPVADPAPSPAPSPAPAPDKDPALSQEDIGLFRRMVSRLTGGKPDAKAADLTDAELDAALVAIAKEPEPAVAAALSEKDRRAIELASEKADKAEKAAREARIELATAKFQTRREGWVEAGVPPAVIEKAEQMLTADMPSIELTNGDKLNPAEVAVAMIEATKGTIDLTEVGHTVPRLDLSKDGDQDDETTRLVKAMGDQFGG